MQNEKKTKLKDVHLGQINDLDHTDHIDHIDLTAVAMICCAGSVQYRSNAGQTCRLSGSHTATQYIGHADHIHRASVCLKVADHVDH